MRIALTGGSGNVGRSVALHALGQSHEVVVLDRTEPADELAARVTFRQVDMADYAGVRDALAGCDRLVHFAGIPGPDDHEEHDVHNNNVVASYNALLGAVAVGIPRIVLASSVNAIGATWSRAPYFDYFPLDARHPTYNEDGYSLSKWIAEQQADSVVRRYAGLSVVSLRFHTVVTDRAAAVRYAEANGSAWAARGLWGYTTVPAIASAALLACKADLSGHHVLWVVAPDTVSDIPSASLAATYYPDVPLRRPLPGHQGFFDCTPTRQLLGWDPRAAGPPGTTAVSPAPAPRTDHNEGASRA